MRPGSERRAEEIPTPDVWPSDCGHGRRGAYCLSLGTNATRPGHAHLTKVAGNGAGQPRCALHEKRVSAWLDELSRTLLESGTLERYVTDHALSGVTSHPTISLALWSEIDATTGWSGSSTGDPRRASPALFALALADV